MTPRKLEVLNIYSGSENSSLNLGAKNTSVYVGANQTTFTKPIHVDDIKEKNDGEGVTFHNSVKLEVEGEAENEAVTKGYVDNADQHLQTKIDELEQELDIVAPRLEGATYEYQNTVGVMQGQMHVESNTFTSPTDTLFFNKSAQDGTVHTWSALEPGDYIEITDTLETRTAENYAMYLVDQAPMGDNPISIKVKLVKGQGAPTDGDLVDAKGFQLGGNDINDLDARYALKNHTHDDLEGGYIVTPLEFPNMSGSQYAGDDQIQSLSSGGSPTGGDAYGFDIPWKWFEKHHPEIIGWVDDQGTALWQGKPCWMSRNTGQSRPGITVKGDWGYRYCDVTIPGFVIHVEKMEEPQWGHKFPEKGDE